MGSPHPRPRCRRPARGRCVRKARQQQRSTAPAVQVLHGIEGVGDAEAPRRRGHELEETARTLGDTARAGTSTPRTMAASSARSRSCDRLLRRWHRRNPRPVSASPRLPAAPPPWSGRPRERHPPPRPRRRRSGRRARRARLPRGGSAWSTLPRRSPPPRGGSVHPRIRRAAPPPWTPRRKATRTAARLARA